MVYAFTETEKKQIENCGMLVVEFKRNLKREENFGKAISKAWDSLMELAEKIGRVIGVLCEKFSEVADNVRLALEEIRENYDYPTSRRYKVVKILSKCTGLEKREVWKITRRTHLARSCC